MVVAVPPSPLPTTPSSLPPQPHIPNSIKFLFGGLSGMSATLFVHPLDLLKNRMQLSGVGAGKKEFKTSFHAFGSIVRNEGILAVYDGLPAGLLRQATYATTRLGIFTLLFEKFTGPNGEPPNFLTKTLLGMTAGVVGAFVGTPAELLLIRMTADGRLPVAERRNYTSVLNAFVRVVKEEGVLTLWRGSVPTMTRGMVATGAQLTSYTQAKELLIGKCHLKDNIFLHFCSSMVAGFVTAIASMPLDIVKTRVQNMKIIDGKPEYRGGVDAFVKIVQKEGFFSLWKGFTPYYARIGPHTVLTLIFLEQLNAWYHKGHDSHAS